MTLLRPLVAGFAGTFRPSGRMGRADFWRFVALAFAAFALFGFLDRVLFGSFGADISLGLWVFGPLAASFAVFGTLALLSAAIRRLHDTGQSSLAVLKPLVGAALIFGLGALGFTQHRPLSGLSYFHHNLLLGYALAAVVLLAWVWLLARPATLGPNRFGSDPHEVIG